MWGSSAGRSPAVAEARAARLENAGYPFATMAAAALATSSHERIMILQTGAVLLKTGTGGTPTTPGNEYTDLANGVFCNALGVTYEIDKRRTVTAYWFGAVGDGTPGTDTLALQNYFLWLGSDSANTGIIGDGVFDFDSTISLTLINSTIKGSANKRRRTGSTQNGCTLVWSGGALPMFDTAAAGHTFENMGVEGNGVSTDFLEINAGGIGYEFDHVYFAPDSFSRSVIRSNGNRMGYSKFRAVYAVSPAPKFLDIDGQGTSNAITPIKFSERCVFASSTRAMTVLYLKDESIELVDFGDATFIQDGYELTVVDTTDTPPATTINVLRFDGNEIDSDTTINPDNAAWRFFKLENVESIEFSANKINAGGAKNYIADIVNSHVTSCEGNYYNSVVTALFNADANSSVRAGKQGFNQRPVFTTKTAGILTPTYGASILIDGRKLSSSRHEIIEIEVTNNSAYTISIDSTSPEWMGMGQVVTFVVKNISGGAIAAPVFNVATFNTLGAVVAPADGFNRSHTFYFNGAKCVEIMRGTADVAN